MWEVNIFHLPGQIATTSFSCSDDEFDHYDLFTLLELNVSKTHLLLSLCLFPNTARFLELPLGEKNGKPIIAIVHIIFFML